MEDTNKEEVIQKLTITDENGVNKEVDILHWFTLESNNKDYVVYTENKEDEKGNVFVYTSEVVEKEDMVELKAITDENVLKEITEILKKLISE